MYNLNSNYYEWFITIESTAINGQFYASMLQSKGDISYSSLGNAYALSIRPCFYLKSEVQYSSGDGTKENPYRISIA